MEKKAVEQARLEEEIKKNKEEEETRKEVVVVSSNEATSSTESSPKEASSSTGSHHHQQQAIQKDSDMIEAPSKKVLSQVPPLDPVPGTVPKWPFTFHATPTSTTTSSTGSNPFTEERIAQEEIEDLVQQSRQYHQGSKRRVFKPTIPTRKRGKSRPPDQH